ncbi:MAG TPA: class I SAM-dependent methyltransferase [Microbacterium sp.]|uniref:class I SAM-dependent methyltransferase n=1 Tax=Microbacterium sp. TaxID=51671 RepID=UPI002B499BCA|nr:class I SAM-dependent methyltransferase [Microbacterium sp.]HKT56312.1 class I SAM-dependent methyltransferase [Microbacterium sp.]
MTTPDPHEPLSHEAREVATSFGADADRYDRARLHYPQALVDAVRRTTYGRKVLDVGIGTGIAAQPFADLGYLITGVEPDPQMAAIARRRGFTIEDGRFEDWDPAGRWFDLVIAGQSWHWIDPVAGADKAADATRPAGRIVVFWNIAEPPRALAEQFADVYRSADTGLPFTPFAAPALDAYTAIFERTEQGFAASGRYTDPQRWRFDWTTEVDTERWLDMVPTFGGFSRMPEQAQADVLAGVRDATDAAGGRFTLSVATVAITALARS